MPWPSHPIPSTHRAHEVLGRSFADSIPFLSRLLTVQIMNSLPLWFFHDDGEVALPRPGDVGPGSSSIRRDMYRWGETEEYTSD